VRQIKVPARTAHQGSGKNCGAGRPVGDRAHILGRTVLSKPDRIRSMTSPPRCSPASIRCTPALLWANHVTLSLPDFALLHEARGGVRAWHDRRCIHLAGRREFNSSGPRLPVVVIGGSGRGTQRPLPETARRRLQRYGGGPKTYA
jgi:hypothetical protein